MTQSVVIQVGQCGNQVGRCFWDLALCEHAQWNKKGIYDEPLSSFFRNVDMRGHDLSVGNRISNLRARAVLIDMEEGVVSELLHSSLGEIFDHRQLITDVSGSGNNWAVGNMYYGGQYKEQLLDVIRLSAEHCDCLQSFFILHSMGGGTGSGVGSRVLDIIQNEYPDVYRFVVPVFPSSDDDVITSPYNCVLALSELTSKADCVLPIENQALLDICRTIRKAGTCASKGPSGMKPGTGITDKGREGSDKPFDDMNNIIANLLLNLTSASRFEGSLNVDLNEITMNLVPFPRLHYLLPAMTPLYNIKGVSIPPRRLDQAFSDAFSRDYQLLKTDPKNGTFLACALMLRGKANISDVRKNIERLRPSLKFVHWNREGWKTGLCSVPPLNQPYSLLSLANNTCFASSLNEIETRFHKLYKRKAHLHHYTKVDGMDISAFESSIESLQSLIHEYRSLEQGNVDAGIQRLKIC
ncbi:PREDICTED: tubulin epsilon chain-like [Amphimedon queenslandica]|uniref:Tubulin/FtsZ GTPase domain-containing protein n=1 Tax=Amphimedon queenslandica TaxID=400682 RepID=A0A1X7VUR8_AMPQE|nr:PREDICTED: tubulin epsilon chain-like [Amphimedon queenslandica]|eukprot:XP_019850502.1 PREDICTED: tubulin epsilon chain-like [Amphimedon queenslandica]